MRRASIAVCAALLSALAGGCPADTPQPPPGTAPVSTATTAPPGSSGPAAKKDPLEGSIFTREQVHAIYAAEQEGGAAKDAALREHRLIDARGAEVPTRARAYERAIQALAEQDPEGWAAFVESLAN